MLKKIKNNQTLKTLLDVRNVGLYILLIVTLSVTWSSIKAIQKNYEIERQISALGQEVGVLEQETVNMALKNQYYKTDAFIELAARKYFGKALPGEQFISVPTEVANRYTHPDIATPEEVAAAKVSSTPRIIQNWQAWFNFFLNRD